MFLVIDGIPNIIFPFLSVVTEMGYGLCSLWMSVSSVKKGTKAQSFSNLGSWDLGSRTLFSKNPDIMENVYQLGKFARILQYWN